MSVQKFRISKKQFSFTTIPNQVLQGLAGQLDALGLYCYLASLPEGWEFYKSHLQETCNVGVNKLDRLLKILSNCGLVTISQVRTCAGKFAHFSMEVNDGTSFKNNDLDEFAHRSMKTVPTVTVPRETASINETSTNETDNKLNISYASEDARDRFDEFWDVYPKKKDKARASNIWIKKNLNKKAEQIITAVVYQALNDFQWQNKQYIPHPSTYLSGERWEDEIIKQSVNTNIVNKIGESKSTVKFYAPGNPDYDRVHGVGAR